MDQGKRTRQWINFFLTTLSMNALLRSTTPRSTSTLRQRRRTRSQGRGCSTWRGSRLRSWRATPQPWPPPTTAACQAWPEKSWRVRAQRPWCWLHHCHPHTPPYYHCHHRLPHCHTTVGEHKHQDPGAGLTNFRLPGQKARSEGFQSFSKRFLTQIFTWRRCLTIMKRWTERRSRIRRRNWKRKSSLLSRTRTGRWGYVFNDICTNIIIIIISTIIFFIAMPYMQESSGGLKAFDSFHNVEKVDPHSMRWHPPIVRNYFGVKMFSYQEPK